MLLAGTDEDRDRVALGGDLTRVDADADLRVAADKKFDEAIPYFEMVEKDLGSKGKLKMDEKTSLKDAYDLLITIYEQKNLKDKVDVYTTKFNNVDKDH